MRGKVGREGKEDERESRTRGKVGQEGKEEERKSAI